MPDTYPKIRALLKFLRDAPVCVHGKLLELDIAVYEDELNGGSDGSVQKYAEEIMGKLKHEYWIKNLHFYLSIEDYNKQSYWHLHDTPVEVV